MDPEDTTPPAPSQGDAETTPPPVPEVAAGEGSPASGGEVAERAHEEREELAQEVMELGLQNESPKSQIAVARPVGDASEDPELVRALKEQVERLSRELQEERLTREATEKALEHVNVAYAEADGKVQELTAKLAQAEQKMEKELKERDDKYVELDTKFERLHKHAKQCIQDLQKEIDDLEARFNEVNQKAEQAASLQLAAQQKLERARQQASEALRSMDAERQQLRTVNKKMDPSQSNVGEGSQGQFPGGNMNAYQPGWNRYIYVYQPPPGWFPPGFQPRPLNVAIMNPSGYVPESFQQAQIPEANVHHSEADLEEVPAPIGETRNKKSVTRTKLGNFNPDEDKNLVKSWLEISCDPITSTGQKRGRMWERIMERYNSRRAPNPERSLRSLQSRWDTIRAEVTLFASYYADSIRENPNGISNADNTTHAVGNFAAVLQRKFGYLHCWELMKDAPQWQDPTARDIATAARGEGFGEESTAATDTVDIVEGQSSPVRSGAQARTPMGRDSAKAAKKKANSDAASTSSAEMDPSGYVPEGFQEAQIPEANVHHSEADLEEVEEVPAPTGKTRNKKSVTRIKLSNFNPDEDKNLVKSWLEISCEPITSTGQKKGRMWERIMKEYNSRRASNPERSLKSLQCRWNTINAEVTLFASYYADSIRENPSGMSDADKTTHAVGNFEAVLQRQFGYLHCWELMKDAPKWQDPTARDIVTATRGEGFGEESTAATDTVDLVEGQCGPVRSGAQARRLMGWRRFGSCVSSTRITRMESAKRRRMKMIGSSRLI